MNFKVGDLVFIDRLDVSGIIVAIDEKKEIVTLDDLWCTKILKEYTLYKVLVQGRIRTLNKESIVKVNKETSISKEDKYDMSEEQ